MAAMFSTATTEIATLPARDVRNKISSVSSLDYIPDVYEDLKFSLACDSAFEPTDSEIEEDKEENNPVFDVGYEETPPSSLIEDLASEGDLLRKRSSQAKNVYLKIHKLLNHIGDPEIATQIQFVKKGLSKFHDLLSGVASENNFLSIVTLVESAMSQSRWRDYSKEQVMLIESAIKIGYEQPSISFADYDNIRRSFIKDEIDTHPRLDFESVSDDFIAKLIADEEED